VLDRGGVERRARLRARNQGFAIRRSRVKDPLAIDYGWHVTRGKREILHVRELDELERWLEGEGR
jgi:hypothetical protein